MLLIDLISLISSKWYFLCQWLCAFDNSIFMSLWNSYDMDNAINKITRSITLGRLWDHSGLVAVESDSVVLDACKSLRKIGLLVVKVFRALILLLSTMDKSWINKSVITFIIPYKSKYQTTCLKYMITTSFLSK